MLKFKFFIVLISFSISSYAQDKRAISVNEYINTSLWSQVFNDLEVQVVLPIITPWVVGVTSINYLNNDALTSNLLKEFNQFSTKNLKLEEITNTIQNSFVNYIPKDSIMKMSAMYRDRLLYTFEIYETDTTTVADYWVPSKSMNESIIFDKKGFLRYFKRNTNANTWVLKNEFESPNVSISNYSSSLSVMGKLERSEFENGLLKRKKIVKTNSETKKESFDSDIVYVYDSNKKLMHTLNVNKKGQVIDSVRYVYADDTLKVISRVGSEDKKTIFFDYPDKNTTTKILHIADENIQIKTQRINNIVSEIQFSDVISSTFQYYNFEYNKQGLLIAIRDYIGSNSSDDTLNKQFVFQYNALHNIKNIKEIDRNGKILKEFVFEYEYM